MEDSNPSTAEIPENQSPGNPAGGEYDAVELRFIDFCKSEALSFGDSMYRKATKLFKETKHQLLGNVSAIGNGTMEEAGRYWFAFVVYTAIKLSKKDGDSVQQESNENGINLCKLLRSARLNFTDFFKELHQFVVKAGPIISKIYGEDWESRLKAKELQANVLNLCDLSKFYKRAYRELFSMIEAEGGNQSLISSETVTVSSYYRFGWLLFLALRLQAFSVSKDLVTCTNCLVSVLAVLIIHIPVRLRNFNFDNSQWFVKKGHKGVDLLASLCNKYNTSEEELRKTMQKTNDLIENILKKKPLLASEHKNESLKNIDSDDLTYYEDLMELSLHSSLSILERDYDNAICNKAELDERVFINESDSILGSGNISAGPVNLIGNKRKFDFMSSPSKTVASPLSPHRSPASRSNIILGNSMVAATPVSTAMTTAKWLRTVISQCLSKPSAQLERFLASCDRDITSDVTRRAHIILKAIFPSTSVEEHCLAGSWQSTNLMDNIWAEQRTLEALKLYYRVLEAMCTAESQILHATNLTSLLTNERFHRCMLACSAELVLATHKTVNMLFPAVLDRTGITAFDLSKVIESFVRHEDSLPRELRRHLNSLEERLLESMVWEKGSSMYNSLAVARPDLSAQINRLGLLSEPMRSLDAIAMLINFSSEGQKEDIRSPKKQCTEARSSLVERYSFTSPVKDRLLALSNIKSKLSPAALQSAFASPTRPNPRGGGETCAETGINIFFSKITKLAAVRINGMIERLQQSQQHIRENVYRLFQLILNHQTSLFFRRHIDQIILCCFYGIAKISKLNLTFKEIIYNYRKQPQCEPQVFRSVFVDWSSERHTGRTGQEHVDVITFYNEIFIPSVRPLLEEICSSGTPTKHNQIPGVDNNREAPASPRVSPFPNLPDMSPKKISAVHNVFVVSPLRTSKMDALISHSSKSYYACVGESTHAYRSPSKDLTDINNHLKSNRKGKVLKLDADVGLVSDSLVVDSLQRQNGVPALPSGAPSNSEQSDS